jgi:alpha-L-fucosidase 2
MHTANSYARLGAGNQALACFDKLCRSFVLSNFFALCNDWRDMGVTIDLPWAPFQIDANMGWSAVVQDMLMLSTPGKIRILPSLPDKWVRGEAGPLLAHGGVEVTVKWDLTKNNIQVKLLATIVDQTIELVAAGERLQLQLAVNEPLDLTM